MVFPMVLSKIASHWLFSVYRAALRLRSYGFFLIHRKLLHLQFAPSYPDVTNCSLEGRESHTLLCDFHGSLLRSSSLFPYFMLVAFEGGSLFRALLLLLSSPFLWVLGQHSDLAIKIMTFITFCGLRTKGMDLVARAVLPKHYLDDLHLHSFEALSSMGRRVVVTSMPRVMVEGFLKEFLNVAVVVGAELQLVANGAYFTGLISISGLDLEQQLIWNTKADVGIVGLSNPSDNIFIPQYCKEIYVVSKEGGVGGNGRSSMLPRSKYPKPLVFHDGRLAFLPTPLATLSLFLWLPLGALLSLTRIVAGVLFPYEVAYIIAAAAGLRFRVGGHLPPNPNPNKKGVLYVCTHRTLLDPVMLSTAVRKAVPTVTYSVSRMSELLAPMRTVRLTRDKVHDAETMRRLLAEGDLALCPEGTTCREPYLLRFSSLFAELAEDIVPVAMEARPGAMYGTTASGMKWLDPLVFLANPTPEYRVELLPRLEREVTCAGGMAASEVANGIQRRLAEALGFECTGLTRKDKYMVLAGNEGVVGRRRLPCMRRVANN